jgi:rhomboid protease GluP
MRQTQGSMICPQCGKLISVSEERCPFCGAWRPGLYGYTPVVQRLFRRFDFVTVTTAACVLMYVISLLLEPSAVLQGGGGLWNLLGPGDRALFQLGMTGGSTWKLGWWWTVLTAIYLHGSLLHILLNMWVFRNVGRGVSDVFGPARSFIIWTVAGAVGFVISNMLSGAPTIGASGSVFGMFAALIVFGRRVGHSSLTNQIWILVIINLVLGLSMNHVNVLAHVGGFLGGWAAAQAMPLSGEKRESLGVQLLAGALVLATIGGFILTFVRSNALLGEFGQ